MTRGRSRTGELNVATRNARLLSLTGRRGAGMRTCFCRNIVLGCDVIGLQETQRPGWTKFVVAGYRVFCGEEDGSSGRAGQYRMGLAVKGLSSTKLRGHRSLGTSA